MAAISSFYRNVAIPIGTDRAIWESAGCRFVAQVPQESREYIELPEGWTSRRLWKGDKPTLILYNQDTPFAKVKDGVKFFSEDQIPAAKEKYDKIPPEGMQRTASGDLSIYGIIILPLGPHRLTWESVGCRILHVIDEGAKGNIELPPGWTVRAVKKALVVYNHLQLPFAKVRDYATTPTVKVFTETQALAAKDKYAELLNQESSGSAWTTLVH